MPLASGTRLGAYEVLAPLGAGGMGEVYRARDSRLDRDVAIKILPEEVASSPNRLARFEREAKTVASLNHPNIVTLHTLEEAEGVRFLVMEVVEGNDLSTLIAPGGLPLAKILEVAIPLADALASAHEKRVVHRDLKPANVMLTRDGRVKVLDFGLAKLMEMGADLDVTRAPSPRSPQSELGQVVGTAPYMAPEQIRGEELDARADLFSFGIVIYELATGTRPFAGKTLLEISGSILHEQPSSVTSVRSDLPADLDRILGRCLEKNPRERFQTALDVANELRALKHSMERGEPSTFKPSRGKVAAIAVLPFVNRSASAEDEYFSDGLADELLTVLSKIQGLRVAARSSAFQFKGQNQGPAIVGEKLRVTALLEGSVRKVGNRVRVSVQLVKVADGYQMWSESYDHALDDIFAVQDDIAHSVVTELRRTLLGEDADSKTSGAVTAEIAEAANGRATNPEAHRLFLLARYCLNLASQSDTQRAIEYLKRALELDPGFALGWAELCRAHSREAHMGWVPPAEGYERGRKAAERALSLEPDLPDGHAQLGWIQLMYDWDWAAAEDSYRRALDLAPGDVPIMRAAAMLSHTRGRFEQFVDLMTRSVELDPLSSIGYANLAIGLFQSERFVECEQACRRAIEISAQRPLSHAYLSLALMYQARLEEARAEIEKEPLEDVRLWVHALLGERRGSRTEADEALGKLIAEHSLSDAFQIAQIYANRGDADEAFEWLERAYEERDGGLPFVLDDKLFRPLHGEPRWLPFLRKMKLVD